MKATCIIPAVLLTATLLVSCSSNASKNGTADTAGAAKADTNIVTGDQKNIKNDSLSGDPSAKGAADPNAKLPKK